MEELSAEELAGRSGVTAEQLGRLVELGILTPTSEGRYRRSDIQRIRVVQAMEEAGFAPEQLAQLIAAGAYNLDWTGVIYPEPTAQSATTLEEAVAATGLPEGLAGRLFDAWELPRPQPGQALRADEEELRRQASAATDEIVEESADGIEIEATALTTLSPALAGRVVRQAMLTAGVVPTEEAIEGVVDLAEGRPGRRRDLPDGLKARRERRYVLLSRSSHGGQP